MAIVVVCPGCHASFQVSEKFAGKQGPCPKCKAIINIPALGEEVRIHEPEFGGTAAKDSKGRPILKPVARVESKVQPVLLAGVVVSVLVAFAVAWLFRTDVKSSNVLLGLGATVLAPPLVLGGYSFLRNQELEPYRGAALVVRVAICSTVYAALWGALWALKLWLVPEQATPQEIWHTVFLVAPPLAIGSLTALATLDLDIGSGFFHYCLYLAVCVLLRLTIGLPAL